MKHDTDQSLLDENGKFAKGNTSPAGFKQNPQNRNPGGWKKTDTVRYKLERMAEMTIEELTAIQADISLPVFEQKLAGFILEGDWKTIREMTDQVYGQPKQTVDTTVVIPQPLAPVRESDTQSETD